MSTLAPHVLTAIDITAARIASRYPYVERDDILQDLYVVALSDSRDVNTLDNTLLYLLLNGRGNRAARAYAPPRADDDNIYTADQVRALLPFVYHGTDEFVTEEADNLRAMVADVASALSVLSTRDRNVLAARYNADLKHADVADAVDLSSKGHAHNIETTAIDRIVRTLRGEAPVWTRPAPARTNPAARLA